MGITSIERLEQRTFLDSSTAPVSAKALGIGEIEIDWHAKVSAPKPDGYRIYRRTDGEAYYKIAEVTGTTFIDGNTDAGTRYYYKVFPFTNASGNQAPLGRAIAVTSVPPPVLNAYPLTDGKIQLDADIDDIGPIKGFTFEWAEVGQAFSSSRSRTVAADFQGGGSASDYFGSSTITGLDPAKEYQFIAADFTEFAHSGFTGASTEVPLAPPADMQLRPQTNETVRVDWTSPSTHTTGFRVAWGRSYADLSHSFVVGKNVRSAVVDGLSENQEYAFTVTRLEGALQSDPSEPQYTHRVSPTDFRFNRDGSIIGDAPFTTDIKPGSIDSASDVAVLPDGRVVAVGASNGDFAIARFDTHGTLDPRFHKTGTDTLDFGGNDAARAVAVLPDGRILVVGESDGSHWAMTALHPSGAVDSNFHLGDLTQLDVGFDFTDVTGVAVDPTAGLHRFYVAGVGRYRNGSMRPIVWGFDTRTGAPELIWSHLDQTFGRLTGKTLAIAVQPDGRLLLAARVNDGIRVARFPSDGTLDRKFGDDGTFTFGFGTASQSVSALTVAPDGQIVICGQANDGFAIARLTLDGSLDTSFNGTGIAITSFGSGAHAVARDVTVLPTGQIVAVGTARGNFAVVRYKPDGPLDPDFDRDGKYTLDLGSPAEGAAMHPAVSTHTSKTPAA